MEPESLVSRLKKLIRVGETGGRPWAIVRFKDLWDAGFASVRKDKIEAALAEVLGEAGIKLDNDPDEPLPSYVTFVSNKGLTVYVGRVEIMDWNSGADVFDAVREVIENN